MKIFKITARSDEHGRCVDFRGSKRAAKIRLIELSDMEYLREQEMEEIELGPTKVELLRFLELHVPFHDNG